jgi:hypothetical protein
VYSDRRPRQIRIVCRLSMVDKQISQELDRKAVGGCVWVVASLSGTQGTLGLGANNAFNVWFGNTFTRGLSPVRAAGARALPICSSGAV